jgi:hypothetical protein
MFGRKVSRKQLAAGNLELHTERMRVCAVSQYFSFFPVPVCAITATGVPGGTFVSMNRFSTLCG